jgi:hypothetical protein
LKDFLFFEVTMAQDFSNLIFLSSDHGKRFFSQLFDLFYVCKHFLTYDYLGFRYAWFTDLYIAVLLHVVDDFCIAYTSK